STLPLVSDGVIYRVLENLLILDGERLSYRTLDVEQIGSVYETMMGFRLEITSGQTIALKPAKASGAPVPVSLEELLKTKPSDRAKWIKDLTDYTLTSTMSNEVKEADSIDGLLAALERRIARNATPQPLAAGAITLMPTDERRKTGSHYTPRSLTEPIVRKTLEPVLAQLGEDPAPDDILELKICDPAMGSGAFLVEACRQLADKLVEAWAFHGYRPHFPEDEDEVLYARRLVAQRCLYGVDKNPMAVDLAKLSLWLATLARNHPFTFLDHALRSGDSLVGLTKKQIVGFHWEPEDQETFLGDMLRERMERATTFRSQILSAGDDMLPEMKRKKLENADSALNPIRMAGDLVIAAFFSADKKSKRQDARNGLMLHLETWKRNRGDLEAWRSINRAVNELRGEEKPVWPFHWEIEFPEVFHKERHGFDAIVGNPPFMGGSKISSTLGGGYLSWALCIHEGAHGNGDLVAHFFRQAFGLLRKGRTLGFIATNTIGQGDTRTTGLRWICENGGEIFDARRRVKWPGLAAVVVSVVHVIRGLSPLPRRLDSIEVDTISAFLFPRGGNEDPLRLESNAGLSFMGCKVSGPGFLFDNTDTATPVDEMRRLVERNPLNQEVIFPYIGGEELNTSPTHAHHRYVINFGNRSEAECAQTWPALMDLVGQSA
ncbi:MAG: N-6 DNA methylase, partial [Planctomycetota bacterium]|nr:N-6 DNA methylase [Planctomycetota bacterium]